MRSAILFVIGVLLLVGLMAAVQPPPRVHHHGPPQNPCGVFDEPPHGAICSRELWDS